MIIFDSIYKDCRVLVTGHTGFKGSWLVQWLLQLGARVGGYSLAIPTDPANFEVLQHEHKIESYQGDIRDIRRLAEVIDNFRPHIIFHMAAQALVRQSYLDPRKTFETNVMGMVNILECIRERQCLGAAVLITSDKAYRNVEWCWGYREIDALGGDDPYSASKSCADLIAQSYVSSFFDTRGPRIAITRAGNVVGGGDWAADRVVPDCIRAWSIGKSVEIRNPLATRPWQHVLEPLSGYLWLGAQLLRGRNNLHGEAFNFGPSADVTQTVAELLDSMASRWPHAKWESPQSEDCAHHEAKLLRLSCDKAQTTLNWASVLRFSETVELTVDWYRHWHEGKTNMSQYTTQQILQYSDLSVSRNSPWIQE